MQKVSIFVDVQNIYYTTRSAFGRHFDYNKFWSQITEDRTVVQAYAYAVDRGDEKQQQFQNILRGIGFEVRLKPYISRTDGSSKGDWDVGIAVDMMEWAQASDVMVLASGDGDFKFLIDRIQTRYRTPVEVYGVEKLSALSLISTASSYTPIEQSLLL